MNAAQFVKRYFEAWNQQDAQAIAGHLSETGTYLDITVHQEMGRDELERHLGELFQLEAYRYELVGEVCTGPGTIAFQYRALARDSQQHDGSWLGAEFITLSSGTATEIVDYYEQRGVSSPQSPIADAASPAQVKRYAKSGLGVQQMEAVKRKLTQVMESDRIYLRHDLALPDLAEILGCSVNHLSQAINAGFGMSFFDYLNQYRVKEAMQLLYANSAETPTVLSVALQVGFNSTSTFYVAFKKVTGKTPAQYRRTLAK